MTNATILIATSLLTAWANAAYPCENNCFSFNVSTATAFQGTATGRLPVQSRDDYTLASTGKIVNSNSAQVMNIINSFSHPAIGVKRATIGSPPTHQEANSSAGQTASNVCDLVPSDPSQIEQLIIASAARYGVDPLFAKAIAWTESRFDQNRTSPKGAHGTMQLMPDTAAELGVGDICDTASNIDGGIRRLKSLVDEFHNPILAAAAYNAGARAVDDAGGVPPFAETIRYVAEVTNYQMGLPMPRSSARPPPTTPTLDPAEEANGVIGAKVGRFIKGVMQF